MRISISDNFISQNKTDIAKTPLTESIIAKLPMLSHSTLRTDFNNDIGFAGVLKKFKSKNGFSVYETNIPSTEKQDQADWTKLYEISATFSLFLELMNSHLYAEEATYSNPPQLIMLHLVARRGLHGGSFDGEYGIDFCNGLRVIKTNPKIQCQVLGAMENAHRRIFSSEPSGHFRFEIRESGGLILDCPGNACGIHPDDWNHIFPKKGYKFGCHNIDTPAQQLTLMAGLAILHEEVDKISHCL